MIKAGPIQLSRRSMLRAFAVGAILGIGGVSLTLRGPGGLIDDILKRGIGRFKMSPDDRTLLRDGIYAYLRSEGAKDLSLRIMGAGYAAVNFPFVRHLLPDDGVFKIEQLERQVITFFLLSTDYLAVTGGNVDEVAQADLPLSYIGFTGICSAPWAQLS